MPFSFQRQGGGPPLAHLHHPPDSPLTCGIRRGLDPMPSSFKRQVAGQPLAQVDNPDPFAVPVWRSPVYQTPHFVIWPVQLIRLVWRLTWFMLRHPALDAAGAALAFTWLK